MTFKEVIKEAISNKHRLEIAYKDYNGKSSLRQISQIQYLTGSGKYISAYCHLRNDKRTFKLNRIEKVRFVGSNKDSDWINNSSDGCYIATMAYGSYEHPQVIELRKFRDDILRRSHFGRLFVKLYYFASPKLVILFKNQITTNKIIRKILDTFVEYIKTKGK